MSIFDSLKSAIGGVSDFFSPEDTADNDLVKQALKGIAPQVTDAVKGTFGGMLPSDLGDLRNAQSEYEQSQQPAWYENAYKSALGGLSGFGTGAGKVLGSIASNAATPGLIGAGAGLLGYTQAAKEREAANANMQKMQDLASQMKYYQDPEVAKIQDDAAAKAAQMKALQGLSDRASMGLTPEDKAALDQIRQQQNSAFQAQQAQIQDNMARRGMSNSGAALAQAMGASQQANQQAAQNATQLASQNFQAKQNALTNLANTAGNITQQQFERDLTRSGATDKFNQANVNLANQSTANQRAAAKTMADYQQQQGTNKAQAYGTIGQGVGTALGAYQQQKKPGQA